MLKIKCKIMLIEIRAYFLLRQVLGIAARPVIKRCILQINNPSIMDCAYGV